MTTPTPEEQAETWKTFEARINARSESKADNAAALQAAGGLASDKTLRDEFAGLALMGIMGPNYEWFTSGSELGSRTHESAFFAYSHADAMLEARKTPKGDV
jgi:hypothetical protein